MEEITYRQINLDDIRKVTSIGVSDLKVIFEDKFAYGYVAEVCDMIVGFAYGFHLVDPFGKKKMFYLHSIDVFEDFQNKGIGTGLLNYIKTTVLNDGFDEMFVITDLDNLPMRKVCAKLQGNELLPFSVINEWHKGENYEN